MMVLLEILLWVIALAAIAVAGFDLYRRRRRERAEREHLARLGAEDAAPDYALPPPPGRLEKRLRAAGLPFGPPTFVPIVVLSGILVFVLLRMWAGPLASLIAGVVAALALWTSVTSLGRWRGRRFEEKLVDAVDAMVSGLYAGENIEEALVSGAEYAEGGARTEMREISGRLGVGMSIRSAVRRMVERFDSEGVRLFTQTLIAKWDVGGDLAPVLQAVVRVMRDRLRMRLQLHAQMTGARFAAVILAIMPYLLLPVFLWRKPEWLDSLFGDPVGIQLFVIAVILQLVGFLWLRRLMRIET